ncbi:UDP-N-acetylglucosamine transporter UGNT1 [Linum grandiflorum]
MESEQHTEKQPVFLPNESKEHTDESAVMSRKGVFAASSYMATAVLLVMFNKAALSSYRFPYANVITLFQMISSCIFLYAMKYWKLISFTDSELPNSTSNAAKLVPLKTLARTVPLAIAYLLYMLVTMEAVRSINVPMYTTLRRTTVAFTMIVEYLLTGKKHSLPVIGSVGIIILGAFIAGARDLSFDAYSYAVVFVANICTAIYLASIARIGSILIEFPFPSKNNLEHLLIYNTYSLILSGKSSGLNSFGLMWCNGVICLPALLIWTSISGDLGALSNFPYLLFPGFQVVMLLSCILAFFINYFVFLNTTINSALTQTICGNLKDVFIIGLGWMLFGGLPFDLMNIVGQTLGFVGSLLYAYCKLRGK